jgi:hypothetical protein
MPKFVLAYSGGLDTSVILKWLQIHHDADVVTLTADLGQKRELVGVKEKALLCGASATYVEDLQHEFVDEYVWPTLKAGALYQEVYPLGSAIGRPLIVKRLVDVAREVGADAIVHGCTGKGNDQVRFEVGVAALAPDLHCLAPVRTWELKSREEEIAWAQAHHVPVSATRKSPYSIDENLWGVSIEAGQLEDPWAEPPPDCWQMTVSPESAPAKPEHLTLRFEHGVPVSIDGRALDGVELLGELNLRAASHGIGRIDMIEDRVRPDRHDRRPGGRHQVARSLRGPGGRDPSHRTAGLGTADSRSGNPAGQGGLGTGTRPPGVRRPLVLAPSGIDQRVRRPSHESGVRRGEAQVPSGPCHARGPPLAQRALRSGARDLCSG